MSSIRTTVLQLGAVSRWPRAGCAVALLWTGSVGEGQEAKLATNLVLALHRAALAEGLVFAEALGRG